MILPAILAAALIAAADAPDPAHASPGDDGDGDAELLRHLDELENLDLLRNLELFDSEPETEPAPDGRPGAEQANPRRDPPAQRPPAPQK